jgi:LuxR family maltose regulon positive regulatory protein
LLQRLHDATQQVIVVEAPAGYGKTILVREWAQQDDRPFAWLSLDERDNDPVTLLAYVRSALDAATPIGADVLDGPCEDPVFFEAAAIPRFCRRWTAIDRPLVLVLDNLHALWQEQCLALVTAMADTVPPGCHLVIAGRGELPISVGRRVAQQQVLWLRSDDMTMSMSEVSELLQGAGLPTTPDGTARLMVRTLGWPAALSLAAARPVDEASVVETLTAFSGTSPSVSRYLHEELLDGLSPELRGFLMRSSVLSVLTAPLCDAVLHSFDSGSKLLELSRRGLLTRSGADAQEFRCHPLLRDVLLSDLRVSEPQAEPLLHVRAAKWLSRRGQFVEAVEHARDSHDDRLLIDMISKAVPEQLGYARHRVVEGWMRRLPDRDVLRRSELALVMAWCSYQAGRSPEPWRAAAERGIALTEQEKGRSPLTPTLVLLNAAMSRGGVQMMHDDAEWAYAHCASDDPWRALACYLSGTALHLQNDFDAAAERLAEGEHLSRLLTVPATQALCLAGQALLAIDADDWSGAERYSQQAMDLVREHRMGDVVIMVPVFEAATLRFAHSGRREEAERMARQARRMLSYLTPHTPWLSLEVPSRLARAYLMLADAPAARTVLAEAHSLLGHTFDAPLVRRHIDEAWAMAAEAPLGTRLGPSAITTAELRVLQMLPTHLSFQEIGRALFVSRNTVKTQAIAAYRKLGVTSRSEAVEAARRLGLLASNQTITLP